MRLSCLLAVLMLMNGPAAEAFFSAQDAAGTNTETTAPPPAEPGQSQAGTKEAPPETAKTPADTAKTTEGEKASEAKPSGANERRGKHEKTGGANASPIATPNKVVVRHGGAKEPTSQIVPNLPPEEAVKLRQNAEGLLGSAEVSLRVLGSRTLQPPKQEALTQVHNYMEKARSALKDGDIKRAHTLALKANVLANDLLKH